MVDDMLKAQSKVIDILCNLELIYPPAFFDIMIHLVIHLPLEAIDGWLIRTQWMYPFERFMKRLKNNVRNKAKPEGSIAKGYVAEEALTFSSHYFRDVTKKFNRLDYNVPGVSESSELFALAYGPSQTPILVNSCVVNEDELDLIHVDNSSDIALSTSLNDLEITALHIDGQSIDVDAPSYIIDVDEDDDIIDEEDPIPHDLVDFDTEDLINLDIDDDVNVIYSNVTRGYDGDSGNDDRPLPYQIPTGCRGCLGKGTRKPNLGGRRAGRMHTRQETQNLGLNSIMDKNGLELDRELSLHYPSWCQMPLEWKVEVVAKIRAALKERYWVPNPEDETYDMERIRRERPSHICECMEIAYDPNPPADETQSRLLKEYLIKFSVMNGKKPLTLNFKTFITSNGLYYNNDEARGDQDLEGLKPLADMEPLIDPVADPSGTGAKCQVDETLFTRFRQDSRVVIVLLGNRLGRLDHGLTEF
uniref:DUF4218 domain-containing protein n=1 Tax=Tanacetum cinerariifolium TaxID=118510 RepID=A0A699H3I7_TANCI|nr:hypothetical protein [Tanacetum cinerariifolium]